MNLSSPSDRSEPPSPCVDICRLNSTRKWCVGCFRTPVEIGGWRDMNSAQKWAVIRALDRRRAGRVSASGAPSAGVTGAGR